MASKKQHESFNKKVIRYLQVIGGERIEKHHFTHYKVKTKAGNLEVSLHNPEKGQVFSIFAKFDDEKKALQELQTIGNSFSIDRLNKYSGKWNFHLDDSELTLTTFKFELTPLLLV